MKTSILLAALTLGCGATIEPPVAQAPIPWAEKSSAWDADAPGRTFPWNQADSLQAQYRSSAIEVTHTSPSGEVTKFTSTGLFIVFTISGKVSISNLAVGLRGANWPGSFAGVKVHADINTQTGEFVAKPLTFDPAIANVEAEGIFSSERHREHYMPLNVVGEIAATGEDGSRAEARFVMELVKLVDAKSW